MQTNRKAGLAVRDALYWTGVAMAIACLALVLAHKPELVWRFQQINIPLSWTTGVISILAFLATEYCDSVPATDPEMELSTEILQQEA